MLRTVLFCVFTGLGLAALTLSVLADELLQLHLYRIELKKTEETNEVLQKLNREYEVVIKQIEDDPNVLARLASVTLGTEPQSVNTAYPKVPEHQRLVAERILLEKLQKQPDVTAPPDWVIRCTRPLPRAVLFFAAAALVVVSFICFGIRSREDNGEQ